MNFPMSPQIILPSKSLPTLHTLMLPNPFMTLHMIVQNPLPRERLPANGAGVRCFVLLDVSGVEALGEVADLRVERARVSAGASAQAT